MTMPDKEALRPLTLLDPQNFVELIDACRRFIRVWADAEFDLSGDLVAVFIAIESEGDEVGKHGRELHEDEVHFYDLYFPYFIDARDETQKAILS